MKTTCVASTSVPSSLLNVVVYTKKKEKKVPDINKSKDKLCRPPCNTVPGAQRFTTKSFAYCI